MTVVDVPTTRLDLASDALAADPWPQLHALRNQGAVVWHETFERWLVTTDRATRKILTDFRHLTVEGTSAEALFGADAFICIDDRRRHDDLRNIWAESFRKQGLDDFMPALRRIVDDLLDPVAEQLRDGAEVDITRAVCRPLPTAVISLMMGVPEDAVADVVRWSDAMATGAGTYLTDEEKVLAHARRDEAKAGLGGFLTELLRRRRAEGSGDDLISTLACSEAGRALSDDQLTQNLRQLLFAGNETTAKWLAHIFLTYGERPELQRELAGNRALVRPANDEVLRWETVVGTLVRKVRGGPIEVAGVTMADGDDVTLLPGAANRDPERYEDPDRFDIHRAPHPHLGFGVGFHNCLGSVLAKVESELAVNGMLDRVPGWRITAPYSYSSLSLRGPMPVIIAQDAG